MANRWGNNGNHERLYFLGLQNHCSHEIKRRLLLATKAMTNLDSILKSRDITLPTKLHLVSQSCGFSSSHVWMWELDCEESRVSKNQYFWTVVLEKILESPLDCKESHPVNLKEISPEYSLEGLMLKLKLQYYGHWCEELTLFKRPWCWERLKPGRERDDRGWDGWMASRIWWACVWASSGSWWWTEKPGVLQSIGFQRVEHYWVTELTESK